MSAVGPGWLKTNSEGPATQDLTNGTPVPATSKQVRFHVDSIVVPDRQLETFSHSLGQQVTFSVSGGFVRFQAG
jgi:hypothetical protein